MSWSGELVRRVGQVRELAAGGSKDAAKLPRNEEKLRQVRHADRLGHPARASISPLSEYLTLSYYCMEWLYGGLREDIQ